MAVANKYRTLFYYELFIMGGAFVSKLNSIVNIFVYSTLSKDFRSLLRPKTSEASNKKEGRPNVTARSHEISVEDRVPGINPAVTVE
jgi:hypothetical protein